MNYRSLVSIVLSSAVMFACTSVPGDHGHSQSNGERLTIDGDSSANPVNETFISPELLYSLLVAEIAFKRGEVDVAVDNYIDAAKASKDVEVIRRATRIADFSRSVPKALQSAKLWVETAPDDIEARQTYAVLLLRSGELEASVAQVELLINNLSEEHTGPVMLQLVAQLSRERDKATVLKFMEQLVQKQANNAGLHFANAQLNMRLNNFASAMGAINMALNLNPDWYEAVALKARILQLENKNDEAISFFESQLQNDALDEVSMRIAFARMLMDMKYMSRALDQYVILATLQPENNDLLYAAGLLSMQMENVDQAEGYFQKLYDLKKRKVEASYYLGQVAESRKNLDKAIQWYSGVRRGELYIEAQMRIAALLSKQKLYDEAVKKVRSIRAYDSRDKLKLYLLEGDIELEAQRYNAAFTIYDRALLDMPEDSNLLYARALAAEKIDRIDILENDLRFILKSEPNNVQALNALGYTLADKTERYDEALKYIKRALALEPKDPAIVDSMGWVYYRMGRHQEALTYLRRAMEIIGDVEIAAHFGEVLWVSNKREEAIKIWDQALKDSPDSQTILDVMRRFGL